MKVTFLYSVFVWFPLCSCYLQEIQEYLGQSLDYLKKGLKMAQDVEDFIDNTIGEECNFECPKKGFEPIPR